MTKRDLPTPRDDADPVESFLKEVARTPPPRPGGGRGRLIFAMDATASREPSWDRACQVQGQMFLETAALGGLDVQLVYYRGFDECRASRWVDNPCDLVRLMTGVFCLAGQTKLGRVLRHAIRETEKKRVAALVFVGDCFEENLDEVGQIAGQLGLLGVRAFLFQEGRNPDAERAFRQIARLTNGAHCRFDASSPQAAPRPARRGRRLRRRRAAGARRPVQALQPRGPTAGQPGPLAAVAMGLYLLLGVLLLVLVLVAARSFVQVSPAHLAQGVRAFIAAFSALASTGLLFTGRLRARADHDRRHLHGAPRDGAGQEPGRQLRRPERRRHAASEVETDTLRMQLDHRTGELEGEVLRGRFAGRPLASLGLSDLLELLADCRREDPRSVALLETYLDRRAPDWRGQGAAGAGGGQAAGAGGGPGMDEATAWQVLGLAPGASVAEIKAAHRRLMTKLHPDHGGSSYLAAQLNQAKDYLLSRQR